MRILLIGGLGFVGARLLSRLASTGHEVTVLDKRLPPQDYHCRTVQADIRDLEAIAPHFAAKDLVINLAAEHQDNVRPVSLYDEVNVAGAKNICVAAERAGTPRILFTSSVAIYGESTSALTEDSPANFFNDYGRTKYEAELVYRNWRSNGADRRLSIIRPTVIFGPGNRGNVYNLLRQIKYGPFLMIGDGSNVKSVAHVDNVAAFLHHVSDLNPSQELVLNYADKPDLSIKELVALSFETLGRRPPQLALPQFAGVMLGGIGDTASTLLGRSLPISSVRVRKFCSNSIVDAARALATGFRPSIDTRAGLREMLLDHV